MSDPFCFSWQCFCVIILLCATCVQVSQPAETWSPVIQLFKVLLLIRVRRLDGTERIRL